MFRKILVPLDRSSFAEQALGPAAGIAKASGAQLTLMMVHTPRPLAGTGDVEWHAHQLPGENQYLAGIAGKVEKMTGVATSQLVVSGDVVPMICNLAVLEDVSLIVMTSHARTGLDRAWIGSVADGVIRKSSAPVLMVRPHSEGSGGTSLPDILESARVIDGLTFQRILVPLDGSSLANEMLPTAISLAQCTGARLVLLRVVEPVPTFTPEMGMSFGFAPPVPTTLATNDLVRIAEQSLTELALNLAGEVHGGIETRVVVASDAGQGIVDFALDDAVDLIAMSTRGRGFTRLLIGSVADKVLRASVIPMLLRRPITTDAGRTDKDGKAETMHLSTVTVI